ncbi:E3 SUMO-protein ligase PIAS2-like isoform X2 [Diadema antillarum]|uniref:E3 SUMO-protein ligase PIAS2-like n=1 Tax=Diadema antillarum TaxID=105358 RepID=UPI003A868D70
MCYHSLSCSMASEVERMADYDDLKHMVMSFRVTELQVLLGYAGRNKSGRKHELQARALSLLKNNCSTPVQIKIKDLYRRRFPRRLVAPPAYLSSIVPEQQTKLSSHSLSSNSLYTQQHGHSQHSPPTSGHHHNTSSHSISHSHSSHSSHNTHSSHSSHNAHSLHNSHSSLSPLGSASCPPQAYHPDVNLKVLPFFDILAELVKPSALMVAGKYRDPQQTILFHLTPSQITQILESQDPRTRNFAVQVQLRFCLAETSCEQDDRIPTSVTVKINGKLCTLPPCFPQNKPGVEVKRPGRPINITQLTRLNATMPNYIEVQWIPEIGRSYCLSVYLVRQLNSEILLHRLRSRNIRNPDHSRALIKEKLSHDPDSEIATTSLRVSLICPLGKMRMSVPCRPVTCTHLQCFDASLYIQMNERKPTWICPVCDKKAPFDSLVIDGLFLEILRNPPESNEIIFVEDGSWTPLGPKQEKPSHILSSPSNSSKGGHSSSQSTPSKKSKEVVIDLTLSSSEEEDDDDDDDDDDIPVQPVQPAPAQQQQEPQKIDSDKDAEVEEDLEDADLDDDTAVQNYASRVEQRINDDDDDDDDISEAMPTMTTSVDHGSNRVERGRETPHMPPLPILPTPTSKGPSFMESGPHSLIPPVSSVGHRIVPSMDIAPSSLSMYPEFNTLLGLHPLSASSADYHDIDLYSLLQSDRVQYPPPPYYMDQGASRSSSVATSSTTSRAGSTGSGHGIGPPDVIPLD